jgi:hypothetical protein
MPLVRRLVSRLGVALLASAGILAASACGDIDGGKVPFAGAARYQEPSGAYELRLLQPPWIPVTISGMTLFVVPPTEVFNTNAKESDMLYSLHILGVGGDPASALAAAATPAWGASSPLPVTALSGAAGLEVSWQEAPGVFHREVFLGTSSGPTFQLHFTAKTSLADDPMITQMILSFAPRGTIVVGGAR